MSTFMANKGNIERKWYVIDAAGKPMGKTAVAAADLLRGKLAAVNLIPLNAVPESGLERSTPERIERFEEMLKVRRITVTVRREMGADIDAACGQLRNSNQKGGV